MCSRTETLDWCAASTIGRDDVVELVAVETTLGEVVDLGAGPVAVRRQPEFAGALPPKQVQATALLVYDRKVGVPSPLAFRATTSVGKRAVG